MTTTLHETNLFLMEEIKRHIPRARFHRTKSTYRISIKPHSYCNEWGERIDGIDEAAIRACIDPEHNIAGRGATAWNFSNYSKAHKKWSWLLLKFH